MEDERTVVPMPPLRRAAGMGLLIAAGLVVAVSTTSWQRWPAAAGALLLAVIAGGWQLDRRPQVVLGTTSATFKRWGFRSKEIAYSDIVSVSRRDPPPNRSMFLPRFQSLPTGVHKWMTRHSGSLYVRTSRHERLYIGDPTPAMSLDEVERLLDLRRAGTRG